MQNFHVSKMKMAVLWSLHKKLLMQVLITNIRLYVVRLCINIHTARKFKEVIYFAMVCLQCASLLVSALINHNFMSRDYVTFS